MTASRARARELAGGPVGPAGPMEPSPAGPVDVLIVAALPEEFDAARAVALAGSAGGGVSRWEPCGQDGPTPFLWGQYRTRSGRALSMALARPTRMGGRATGPITTTLTDRLGPSCLAMCGVCAGNPADTALGDVVVADVAYEWDEGKLSPSGLDCDHQQIPLDRRWIRFAQDFDPAGLPSHGTASRQEAMLWLLERLHLGYEPRDQPGREQYFPRGTWTCRLAGLEADGLIARRPAGGLELTGAGAALLARRRYDDVDGPRRLPFTVRVAPMASGSAVITDPRLWRLLRESGMRKVAAVEMEAATVATVAAERQVPLWLVAKGVTDSVDPRKDDRYRRFAARASAEVLFALLDRHLPAMLPGGGFVSDHRPPVAAPADESGPAGHGRDEPGRNGRRPSASRTLFPFPLIVGPRRAQ